MTFTSILTTMFDLMLVIAGFTLIIVLHELGHFLAARWAGIRVLAFAVGFGPAIVSFRKGLGWRKGSSEPAFRALPASQRAGVSPTEYRVNVLPLGGYVKMLGQDDADPSARSNEPDSYQQASVYKRMVVISAGVVANLISAVLLYIIVFSVGLKTEPPMIGAVLPGSPAATAVALNAAALGVTEPGLRADDVVIRANGRTPDSFNDLQFAAAMSARNQPVRLEVRREGLAEPLRFEIVPRVDETTRMLSLGVTPAFTARMAPAPNESQRQAVRTLLDSVGLTSLQPDMTLTRVNDQPADSAGDLRRAVERSDGAPVRAVFEDAAGRTVDVALNPLPRFMDAYVPVDDRVRRPFTHLLGLTPALGVHEVIADSPAQRAGLKPGDVFVQVGDVEWPSLSAGIAELRASAGTSIPIAVARPQPDGSIAIVDIGKVPVTRQGTLGFSYSGPTGDPAEKLGIVARWPAAAQPESGSVPSGAALPIPAGARITTINDQPVASLFDLRRQLITAARAHTSAADPLTVQLGFTTLVGPAAGEPRTLAWSIPPADTQSLLALGYDSPIPLTIFEPASTLIRGENVLASVGKGVKETHRVMMMTYLTFARLFEGTVKIEHLKGPVGIAHIGVLIADRGTVWLLFFMALISVNLAVINFLPLPIVDGGHMLYLLYERFTGKQPPIAFQNAAALVGLVLIGTMFVIVTFHDVSGVISHLFG